MGNVNIKFFGSQDSEKHTLEAFCNDQGMIFIEIAMVDSHEAWITLNKATAIQLVKKLKAEISKIESK